MDLTDHKNIKIVPLIFKEGKSQREGVPTSLWIQRRGGKAIGNPIREAPGTLKVLRSDIVSKGIKIFIKTRYFIKQKV